MSRLEYDDVGSTFFGIGLGISFLVPFTIHVARNTYKTLNGVDDNATKPRTTIEKDQVALFRQDKSSKALITRSFLFKVFVIIVGWLVVGYLYSNTDENVDIATFDPWDIMGIEKGTVGDPATEKRVKSAYRKLSFQYHPDRMVNADADAKASAMMIFEKVQKSNEILTNIDRYKIFIQTGSADGSKSMEVSIGLPKFLMTKRNHNVILVLYLLLLCVVTPIAVGSWYFNSTLYGDRLTLNDTYGVYAMWLEKDLPLQHFPEVLALSAEFRNLCQRSTEEEALLQEIQKELRAEGRMTSNFWKKTKQDRMMEKWPGCARANVLIHAYLNRRTHRLTIGLREDLNYVLHKSQMLIPAMLEAVGYTRLLQLIKTAARFEQYMTQALWIQDHPFQQLPHVSPEDVECVQRISGSMNKLLLSNSKGESASRTELIRNMDTIQKLDIETTAELLPRVQLTASIGCVAQEEKDGSLVFEKECCEGDILTAELILHRSHTIGPVHAPYLPFSKEEEWLVVFTKEGEKSVLSVIKMKGMETIREKIPFPSKNFLSPGTHKFDFHLMSLSYIDFDRLETAKVTLQPEGNVVLEELHPEDQELDKELSMFEEAFGKAEESDDSGFLDSDDEESKKSQSSIAHKKQRLKNSLAISDDEDTEITEAEPEIEKSKKKKK